MLLWLSEGSERLVAHEAGAFVITPFWLCIVAGLVSVVQTLWHLLPHKYYWLEVWKKENGRCWLFLLCTISPQMKVFLYFANHWWNFSGWITKEYNLVEIQNNTAVFRKSKWKHFALWLLSTLSFFFTWHIVITIEKKIIHDSKYLLVPQLNFQPAVMENVKFLGRDQINTILLEMPQVGVWSHL